MNGFMITLLLMSAFSLSSYSQDLSTHNIARVLNVLSEKEEGWKGNEVVISSKSNGSIQIKKSEGGYGFTKEGKQAWSYGFGFCTVASESMCSEGLGSFRIRNGQLYLRHYGDEMIVKVLESLPAKFTYSLIENTPEGKRTHTIQLQLSKSKTFIHYKTVRLNGQLEWASVFHGK